ncbi:histone-like transcription factor and archaeal histone [Colletotrichum graminicola]|uniref:Histone-like transcription factor and archaeal histone n=1 Tax=Colletotrichum graminicola (strain M1.001 / M2 / FGSC 10212) TaxID=645133 RepID=E3Q363_COLGM|nr:histone-like transcription factor and archaeal histone [Colletotrichum graminicola M1.001]EFQ25042.1 histone-like transcription factor and archaeal histone [Colletotrichum graminicola M1.001]WDK15369.1 histone-like transcription factor and archaeal histone [Colletotrichum graminicola]
MADDTTTTYAPKSPDLSSFFSAAPAPPTPPLHNLQHNQQYLNELQTAAPPVYEYSSPSPRAYHPHQSSSTPVHIKQEQPHYPYSAAIKSESVLSSHQPPLQSPQRQQQQHQYQHQPQYPSPRYHHSPPQQHQQHPSPQHPQSAYGIQPAVKHQEHQQQPHQPSTPQSQGFLEQKIFGTTPQLYDIPYYQDSQHLPQTPGSATMPPRKNTQSAPSPPPIDPSPVRTKFPTARIKRIMQADEEVGKVAQQTPIAVGKALEMFMIAVVSRSAEIAREKNSKRVTAQMLKQVIETDGQYDFLADIAAKVGDEEKRGGRSKAESESEEEMEVETKKKGKGGRKKKAA